MVHPRRLRLAGIAIGALFALAACAPAPPPSPTTGPPAKALTSAPAKPTEAPAAKLVEAKPAASPAAKEAASPIAQPEPKPAASPAAKADTRAIEDFYRGKTVRLIVGLAAGGGYDTYSRAIARHIGKLIPGNPTLVVENMPGAGSILAANHVYNVAPKDGTVIVNFTAGSSLQQVFGTRGIEFDAANFTYLGVPARDHSLCIATKNSGIKSLQESIGQNGRTFTLGADAPGSATADDPAVLREALGANLKIVQGYAGTARVRLAMEQGEVEGVCGQSWESVKTSVVDRVQSGDWVIVSQNTERAVKDLPNVPVAWDLARTPEARQLLHYGITLAGEVQRYYAVAPGVPAERTQALRDAFARTLRAPEFLADAEKAKLDIEPVSGEETQKLATELLSMPADLKARLKPILRP